MAYQNNLSFNPLRDVNITSFQGAPLSSGNALPITGTISASNSSVGTNTQSAPPSSTEIGWIDGSGNLQGVSASNPLPVSASVSVSETLQNVVGSTSSAAVLSNFPITNTSGLRSVAIQVTNAGGSCTLVAESSNDGTTWIGLQSVDDMTTETTPMTTIGQYVFNFTGLQFRVRCSIYGTGTPAVSAEFRQYPIPPKVRDLLTGLATSALQTTGNTSLSTIATNTTNSGTPTLQSGSITAVTQATAANLNATVSLAASQTLSTVTTVGTLTSITNDVNTQPATDNLVSGTASTTGTASTQAIALSSGKSLYITSISISNSSATTITVNIQDGSGGTVLGTFIAPAGGGNNPPSSGQPLFKTTSGNGLYFVASSGVSTLYVNASGFSK